VDGHRRDLAVKTRTSTPPIRPRECFGSLSSPVLLRSTTPASRVGMVLHLMFLP
jgi:hypothetical protein